MIRTFKTKPVTIEAAELGLDYDTDCEIMKWCGGDASDIEGIEDGKGLFQIHTLEGAMWASPGDFVIKGLRGEFYPCKPDVFHAKYEEVIIRS